MPVCLSVCVFMCLQLYVDAEYTELKLPIDILIGTVPLRETVRNLPFQPIIANQPPSAPPIGQTDVDNFDLRTSHRVTSLFSVTLLL